MLKKDNTVARDVACSWLPPLLSSYFTQSTTVRATPLCTGFVDIFIGQIHSESDDQIQEIIYQIDDNDLLDYSV